MGDSITEQWPIRGRKEFFTSNDFKGVGIGGQTSRDMLARMWGDVLSNDPQLVVVAAGTNDLAYNNGVKTSREDILSNVMLMVELSKAWGAEVIVGSSFPSRHYWWNFNGTVAKDFWNITPEQTAQRAIELGKILKAYAEQKGYRYADYFSVLKDDENNLADPYCYPVNTSYAADGLDRVHPNAAGYLEMEEVLKPLVDAALNDPDQINPGDSSIDDMGKIEW
jgi:lysophospholipase L1-like esterase